MFRRKGTGSVEGVGERRSGHRSRPDTLTFHPTRRGSFYTVADSRSPGQKGPSGPKGGTQKTTSSLLIRGLSERGQIPRGLGEIEEDRVGPTSWWGRLPSKVGTPLGDRLVYDLGTGVRLIHFYLGRNSLSPTSGTPPGESRASQGQRN